MLLSGITPTCGRHAHGRTRRAVRVGWLSASLLLLVGASATTATSPAGERNDGASTIIDADGWSYCRGPSLTVTNFGEDGEIWHGPIGVRPNPGASTHPAAFTLCFGPTLGVDREGFEPVGPSFRFIPGLRAPPEGYPPYVLLRIPADQIPPGYTMDDVDLAILPLPTWIHGPREPAWVVLGQIRFLGPPGVGEFALGIWPRSTWAQPVVKTTSEDAG